MEKEILIWIIPAVIIILVTQFTRNHLVKTTTNNEPAICNGFRWLLILASLLPIFNIAFAIVEILAILVAYIGDGIQFRNASENLNRFLNWWRN